MSWTCCSFWIGNDLISDGHGDGERDEGDDNNCHREYFVEDFLSYHVLRYP